MFFFSQNSYFYFFRLVLDDFDNEYKTRKIVSPCGLKKMEEGCQSVCTQANLNLRRKKRFATEVIVYQKAHNDINIQDGGRFFF